MSDPISPSLVDTLARTQVFCAARGVEAFLVGGLLRDQWLGRPFAYLNADFAVARGAIALCRELADALPGAFVPLDDEAGSARVVVEAGGARVELDISDFRGKTLEEDLRRRDFTVNAMAMPLAEWLRHPQDPAPVVDPLNGADALRQRRLIACFPGTFADDPVRILRGFRFASQLGFTLDPELPELMRPSVPALVRVSGERIRDELFAILETDRAHAAVQALNGLGVLDVLWPELVAGRGMDQGPFHHLDVLSHQIETVLQADRFLAEFAEFSEPFRAPLAGYCAQQLVERRSRKSLIKLSGLLHDIGKPERRTIEPDGEIWFLGHDETGAQMVVPMLERLRLSNREAEMVRLMVRHHLRPGFLSREPQLTRRAVYRFYKDLGDHGPACALTWWADRMATRGSKSRLDQIDQQRAFVEELLGAYFFKAAEVVRPPRLVDGRRLMEAFGLPSGPLIGELLAAIEEAQAEGRVRTAEEALAVAKELLDARGVSPA